jgi:hypothetical protein
MRPGHRPPVDVDAVFRAGPAQHQIAEILSVIQAQCLGEITTLFTPG